VTFILAILLTPLFTHKELKFIWVWWYIPVISILRRQKKEDCEFEVSLGYIVIICLNTDRQTHTDTHTQCQKFIGDILEVRVREQ
jgi:hypothetical protein